MKRDRLIKRGCCRLKINTFTIDTRLNKRKDISDIAREINNKFQLPVQEVLFPLQSPFDWHFLILEPAMINPSSQSKVTSLG